MKICVVVTARASWAKLQTLCEALQAKPDVELQIIACASALLERYGNVSKVIQAQGFPIAAECWSVYEGENLLTSAKETGALLCELATVLQRLRPDVVVVCADRHEVLAVAQAAAYQHLRVAHIQGGEKTGSIDDRVRDAITHLSTDHFVCTELAQLRVYGLTGSHQIWRVGCGSIDIAKRAQSEPPVTSEELGGAGDPINLTRPFGVLLQHPVTNEAEASWFQMYVTFRALDPPACLPFIGLWPGQDAGAAGISKAMREFQTVSGGYFHTVRNLPPNRFLKLLTQCSVLVGNSSAGIREASYLGIPVVNIGTRQHGRERAKNVIDVPHDAEQIAVALEAQIAHGPYPSSNLYGSGNAGQQIAEVLTNVCVSAHSRT